MIESKVNQKNMPFYLLPLQTLTNNLNAIQSTTTKKSIDFDTNNKLPLETNEKALDITYIE